jgi:hypothetical protein
METDDIPVKHVSNWQPIIDKVQLALLGKLGEEAAELGVECCKLNSIISRCIIQGLDGENPATKQLNQEALEEEIADVRALMISISVRLNLSEEKMNQRMQKKIKFKAPWFDDLASQQKKSIIKAFWMR